ncbi:MAG: DJ-1/PfpI family protein [Gammaproteobacteria bacterium]|nr:DJ-1/PfpI family protein [Gammaproteobacteria bacterium]
MVNVLIPLAEGFEELEAITVIDLLRRAKFNVITAGLDANPVRASRQNVLIPDTSIDRVMDDQFDLIVLPGGLPGADNLRDNPSVQSLLKRQNEQGKMIGAICAAPKALASAGILQGKTITCYPGSMDQEAVSGINISADSIKIDGNIITSRGPGTAMDFALALIAQLGSEKLRDSIAAQMVRE